MKKLKIQLHLVRDLKEEKKPMNISVKLYCRQDIHSMQKPLVYLFKTYIKKKKGSQFGEINGQEGE